MADKHIIEVDDAQAAILTGLLAALGNGQGATPTAVAQALSATEERPAYEVLMEERGVKPAKGSTVLTSDGVKAAARVLKSGKPEVVASPEGNGDHVVLFTTDKGNLRVQNAYTPKG
jgi:hypothetical protein